MQPAVPPKKRRSLIGALADQFVQPRPFPPETSAVSTVSTSIQPISLSPVPNINANLAVPEDVPARSSEQSQPSQQTGFVRARAKSAGNGINRGVAGRIDARSSVHEGYYVAANDYEAIRQHDIELDDARMMRQAFLQTMFIIAGGLLLLLLYMDWLLLQTYISPLFWSALLSIATRGTRNAIVHYLSLQAKRGYWNTILDLVRGLHTTPLTLIIVVLVAFLVSYSPLWWLALIFVAVTLAIMLLLVKFSGPRPGPGEYDEPYTWVYFDTLVASFLVLYIVVTLVVFIIFCVYKLIDEGTQVIHVGTGLFDRHILQNQILAQFAVDNNITADSIFGQGRTLLDTLRPLVDRELVNVSAIQNAVTDANDTAATTWTILGVLQSARGAAILRDVALQVGSRIGDLVLVGGNVVLTALSVSTSVLDQGVSFLVFVTTLFYFVRSDMSLDEHVASLLPSGQDPDERDRLTAELKDSVRGIFAATAYMSLTHAIVTGFCYWSMGIPFVYLASFVSALAATIPLVASWVVAIPGALWLFFGDSEHGSTLAVTLFVLHILLPFTLDVWIYARIPNTHPYAVGMSIVMGIYAFGIDGAIKGPMLVCVTVVLRNLLVESNKPNPSSSNSSAGPVVREPARNWQSAADIRADIGGHRAPRIRKSRRAQQG